MSKVLPNLFKGIAVVIDNGIGKGDTIDQILENIRAGGGHAVELLSLPSEDYDLEHFAKASFFIMDWNLGNSEQGEPLPAGVRLTGMLDAEMIANNIAFLKRLSNNRHAPVFIFTNEAPEVVIDELKTDADLHRSVEESHILVQRKADVIDKVYEVLETWAEKTPSVLTLKTWERAYMRAANELFVDLYNKTPYWPVLLWQTFGADGVPPEVEMGRLLNRLAESRMGPLDLDLAAFTEKVDERRKKSDDSYRQSMYRVLEGERFLREVRLKADLFAPGDVFGFPLEDGRTSFYMNVRPECDCLRGNEDMQLYLLQAKVVADAETKIDKVRGNFVEKDSEAIVYAMVDGVTYSVQFKDLKIKSLKQIKKDKAARVGRLLPPFLTRIQQRYANYVQRPGMPRIPPALYESLQAPEAQPAGT